MQALVFSAFFAPLASFASFAVKKKRHPATSDAIRSKYARKTP